MEQWSNIGTILARQFKCGYCDKEVASDKGYKNETRGGGWTIYICPSCSKPVYFENEDQHPSSKKGNRVEKLPTEIESLYNEARTSTTINANTAAVLLCRKLLMHIAVEKGAKTGESFLFYVDYLAEAGYVPPDGKGWVDHIREKGNEANHEIVLMKSEDAEDLLTFSEMLLKFIYEFPSKVKKSQDETIVDQAGKIAGSTDQS